MFSTQQMRAEVYNKKEIRVLPTIEKNAVYAVIVLAEGTSYYVYICYTRNDLQFA